MHISKLSLVNYRNFPNAKLLFKKGINTIIGENGAGKTNVFRAMRLLLDDFMVRAAHSLTVEDFNRGIGKWQGHWIVISMEFSEISEDESAQALFIHGSGQIGDNVEKATYNLIFRPNLATRLKLAALAPGDKQGLQTLQDEIKIVDYETIFTGRSTADFNDQDFYKDAVGDFEGVTFSAVDNLLKLGTPLPKMMSLRKEVSFTFVKALRDVVSDFQNNRTNPLLTLLKGKSELDKEALKTITDQVSTLNINIEKLDDVQIVKKDILKTIQDTAGEAYSPSSLSIKSGLPDDADKLFQSLKLFIGESGENHEGPIHDLSLGGANLIYLTLKLLEFQYSKARELVANFLLIEEPEAHIHTHIQKTLFDRLNYKDTQIIYSTHSTQISEVSNVESVNILSKEDRGCSIFQPTTGLEGTEIRNIQRYLDAVRSNLLFAKSIILVEGDAEEILIPIMVKKVLGISLDELGISLINIRSTGFKNVATLFHDDRIQKRCAILTDLDAAFIDTTTTEGDKKKLAAKKRIALKSQKVGLERQTALTSFSLSNEWIQEFYADNTFEVDFITTGNISSVVGLLDQVYTKQATRDAAKADLESGDIARYGTRILTMAAQEGKGWFAILLGGVIDYKTVIPKYILEAILFAHAKPSEALWIRILTYRLNQNLSQHVGDPSLLKNVAEELDKFKKGKSTIEDLTFEVDLYFPSDDIIHAIIARS